MHSSGGWSKAHPQFLHHILHHKPRRFVCHGRSRKARRSQAVMRVAPQSRQRWRGMNYYHYLGIIRRLGAIAYPIPAYFG